LKVVYKSRTDFFQIQIMLWSIVTGYEVVVAGALLERGPLSLYLQFDGKSIGIYSKEKSIHRT